MNRNSKQIIEVSAIFYNAIRQGNQEEALDPMDLPTFKKNHVKLLYPHKQEGQNVRKYYCSEACCESPGYFCCFKSPQQSSEFMKFGLGICLYFKFLKHSIIFYFFLSLLAVLSCVVCYKVAEQNNVNTVDNYSNFLFATTYGSFSSEHNKCQYSRISNNLGIYQSTFNLKCRRGQLSIFDSVLSKESLDSLYNCRNQRKKQQSGDVDSSITKYRSGSPIVSCNSDNSQCSISETYSQQIANSSYTSVAYTFQCINNHYKIGTIQYKSSFYLYFVIGIDLFFCIFFMIFIISQIGAEKDEIDYFKMTNWSLEDYSIQISGFTVKSAEKEFQTFMKALQKYDQNIVDSIASYTFPQNEAMLNHYKDKFQIFREVTNLIKQYYMHNNQNQHLTFKQCHEKMFNKEGGEDLFKQYSKRLQKLIKNIFELDNKIYFIQKTSQDKVPLFLVFDSVNKKHAVQQLIEKGCCSNNQIRIGNKVYEIETTPVPDMISWDNMHRWTKIRVLFSWILTIAICLASYLLFGYIQFKQRELFNQYNYGIDCNVLYTSAQLANLDPTLSQQANYKTCICKNQNLLSFSSQNSGYCQTWKTQYRLYLVVPLLISLGIVVYNIVVSYSFRWMGYFQKHKFLIDEELSFTLKRAFLLIMNMGLIMILLNYNYNNQINLNEISFIFLGKYDDFSADWYQGIGSVIILTLIFNIATPITEFFLSFILKFMRRCWDTRCCRVPTSSTTKSQYLELYIDDIFPIGERYAYLIATFFVTFSFSGILPILIPISAISFFLLYFSDKLLLFKFYQTPKNYTTTLHKFFIKVLIFSFVSHFALTTYFLTEPTLIAANSNITSMRLSPNNRINAILTTSYVYPYLGFLALVIVYLAIDIFCVSFFSFIKSCACFKQSNISASVQNYIKNEVFFWRTLSKLQIQKLLKITQYNLNRYRLRQQGDINTLISMVDKRQIQIEKTNYAATAASLILQKATQRLHQRSVEEQDKNMVNSSRAVLVGLPSYDYLMKKDKLSNNTHKMAKIETELKCYYKNIIRIAHQNYEQKSNGRDFGIKKDSSAAQLHRDQM